MTMGHHTPPAIGTGVFDSCDIFRYIVVRKSPEMQILNVEIEQSIMAASTERLGTWHDW